MALWEEIAEKKRLSNWAKIPKEWLLDSVPSADEEPNAFEYLQKILPPDVVAITNEPATELVRKMSKGELTSYEVTRAFCHRASLSHQLTNCLTEIFFDQALADAKKLDEYLAQNGKVIGPLHGLPISLKDQVNLEGIDTSIGYTAAFINDDLQFKITDRKPGQDSLIAKLMRDAGAIFYCKTTVPMAMMASDTTTGLFGDTLNAIDRHFSPGGSSGGEGALVASGGSIIGFGTDIGGSIRIPSSFNGLFGLRPSSNRLPYLNVANSMAHQPILPSVIGPMARYLDDLKMVTKTIIDSKPWEFDTKVPPIPWREFDLKDDQFFNFGVMEFDGVVTAHPAFKRAIDIVKQALSSKGHDVFKFELPVHHDKIIKLVSEIFVSDSMQEISQNAKLADEPVSQVVLDLCPQPWKTFTVSDHWQQAKLKYEYQQEYNQGWLDTANITKNGKPMDAYILPSWTSTSFKVGRHGFSPSTYTVYLNGLDYSVLVIPITKVDKDKDLYPENYKPLNKRDETNFNEYDPESYHGLPVCIQLVTRKYEEEKAIALGQVIVNSLQHQ